jgi:hypothetical protein
MKPHASALLGAALLLTSPSILRGDEACSATYRKIPDLQVQRVTEWAEVSFRVALIGCSEQLAGITDREIADLTVEILLRTKELSTVIVGLIDEVQTRRPIVNRLNERLGRDAISDLFLYSISVTEFRSQ